MLFRKLTFYSSLFFDTRDVTSDTLPQLNDYFVAYTEVKTGGIYG
jgi:hypothetical protein